MARNVIKSELIWIYKLNILFLDTVIISILKMFWNVFKKLSKNWRIINLCQKLNKNQIWTYLWDKLDELDEKSKLMLHSINCFHISYLSDPRVGIRNTTENKFQWSLCRPTPTPILECCAWMTNIWSKLEWKTRDQCLNSNCYS